MGIALKNNFKMLAVLAMCLAAATFFCLGAGAAEAADVDVTFYQADGVTPSMANGAINGTATYDDVAETLTIPLQPIVIQNQSGYIDQMTVALEDDDVTAVPNPSPYPSGGSIIIPIPEDEAFDGAQFDVGFIVGLVPSGYHINAPAIMDLDFI
jgi:hypothetical protein